MSRRLLACLAVGVAGCFLGSSARAQPKADGFALDRFDPSERGSDWFTAESLDLRGHQRFAAGLVLDYAHNPLAFYTKSGDSQLATIVGDAFYGHFGGAVTLWDRVRFGLNFPVAFFQDGEGATTTQNRFGLSSHTAIGDLRVGGDVRLYGEYRKAVELAVGLQLVAPTGSRASFTGDGGVRVVPRVLLAGEMPGFIYAAKLGMNVRTQTDAFAGSPMGSEVGFAVAAGMRTDQDRIVVGPELYGSTVVTNGDAFFARRTTPVELLLGGHYAATQSLRVGTGFGPGLTRAFGTPMMRVVASLEWVEPLPEPPPPPRDRDGDKILDPVDACPDEPGVKTDDPRTNGCPPPKDRDGDEIIDAEDACPDEPGVKTDDPKTNGCPPPKDRDGDGIVDGEDACPDDPGPKNEDPKKNGCPVAHVEKGQIRIREQVQFAYNSAEILRASDFILEAVAKILVDNPEIQGVEVQGHTDNKGGAVYNQKLSERRAASVVKWLVKHGIDKGRLTSHGYGKEQPIDTNDTDEGRANNRRVEFHITGQGAAAPAEPAKDPGAK